MSRASTPRPAASAGLAAAVAVMVGLAGCGSAGRPPASGPAARITAVQLRRSVAGGYLFLNEMMDKYAAGSVPRLVQSFAGGPLARQHFTAAEVYDNALVISAYLAAGTAAGRSRAEIIGNGLLYVQASDPQHDGRVRAAYAAAPLRAPADVRPIDTATDTGDLAWAGLALVRLYAATGRKAYLAGAEAIGRWVQAHCYDTRGSGGYTGGQTAGGQQIPWKSTEHNIDLYAFFGLLAAQTRDPAWSASAARAGRFVAAMWNPQQGRYYVGTTVDGVTPNDAVIPEDINSWSYLAFRNPADAASVSWDERNLGVFAGGFKGVSFCHGDRSGAWLEGTAHLADALEFRGAPGDAAGAAGYLSDISYAQAHGPGHDGRGVMSASKNGLSDCSGGSYYASLHTGSTAWFLLAAGKVDPLAGPLRRDGR